jgi:thymidylate synthase
LLELGDARVDRTEVGTRSLFGEVMRYDLQEGLPLLTTKKVAWATAAREMLWFLSGDTKLKPLLEQKVRIWTEWPHKKYEDATGERIGKDEFERRVLNDDAFASEWGDLGPIYGKQWRRWRGADGVEHDQIARLIDDIRKTPASRRLLFTGWNVAELQDMALPPCHMTYQFHVAGDRLSCALYQRSADVFLGVPFNLFGAALLTHMIAQQTDLKVGRLIWFGGDVHLYSNAEEQAREQIARAPRDLAKLSFARRPATIDDYRFEDIRVEGYDPHPPIKARVAV